MFWHVYIMLQQRNIQGLELPVRLACLNHGLVGPILHLLVSTGVSTAVDTAPSSTP